MNKFLILLGKCISTFSKSFNLGGGSTWPGHIALTLNPNFIQDVIKKSKIKIILISGTNGKTTTSKLTQAILETAEKSVVLNESGANLLNGVASSIILASNFSGNLKKDYAIFEVDENTVPLVLNKLSPDYVLALNLFRDQLDRYGEVDTIARNWKESFDKMPTSTTFILNGDDPLISYLGENVKSKPVFFGLNDDKFKIQEKQNAADSVYCLFCGKKLFYNKTYFSHLGDWYCSSCKNKRHLLDLSSYSFYPLSGTYNIYNTLAVVLLAKKIGIKDELIKKTLKNFTPAFGRQEMLNKNGKSIQLFLSKNPTSFNESLRTIKSLNAKDLLVVLNDRIPDGKDVSWIWDTDVEELMNSVKNITVSGDRAYDMGLRIKYAFDKNNLNILPNLRQAIKSSLKNTENTLYILPTYSAMLETRKILTGKKIL